MLTLAKIFSDLKYKLLNVILNWLDNESFFRIYKKVRISL